MNNIINESVLKSKNLRAKSELTAEIQSLCELATKKINDLTAVQINNPNKALQRLAASLLIEHYTNKLNDLKYLITKLEEQQFELFRVLNSTKSEKSNEKIELLKAIIKVYQKALLKLKNELSPILESEFKLPEKSPKNESLTIEKPKKTLKAKLKCSKASGIKEKINKESQGSTNSACSTSINSPIEKTGNILKPKRSYNKKKNRPPIKPDHSLIGSEALFDLSTIAIRTTEKQLEPNFIKDVIPESAEEIERARQLESFISRHVKPDNPDKTPFGR